MISKYKVVEPVILGGKIKGYVLKCSDGAKVVWRTDSLKSAMKDGRIVVDGLHLTMNGALKRDKVVDYEKLVNECNSKSNNAKKLAQTLYDKWLDLGSGEEHLIGIYKAMSVITLSTYELERLTKKRLIEDEIGYSLENCSYDDTVTMESLKSINTECCVKNANALGVLNTYKSKYSISDSVWSVELERLQTLCGTTDIYVIADFIETNFL